MHVCHCYPYTFTDLQHCLWAAEQRLVPVPPVNAAAAPSDTGCSGSGEAGAGDAPAEAQTTAAAAQGGSHASTSSCSTAGSGVPSASGQGARGGSRAGQGSCFQGPGIVLRRQLLAKSLAGNAVDVLTITAPAHQGMPLAQRKGVVLSCER